MNKRQKCRTKSKIIGQKAKRTKSNGQKAKVSDKKQKFRTKSKTDKKQRTKSKSFGQKAKVSDKRQNGQKATDKKQKYDHFEDKLTPEEEEEVTREKKIKQAAFAVLSKRDSELQKIREGEFAAKKPKLMTQEEQDRAFKNYMKMFYDKPRLTIPPDDPFPSDTASDYLRRGEIDE
ncbi:Hypothetical predicted protein, partial [Mytilus galloprovincialis]